MNKLLLFDFDGVLADTIDDLVENAECALLKMGIRAYPTKEIIRSLERMEFDEFARCIGVPEERNNEFVQTILDIFSAQKNIPPIFPGMKNIISELSGNILCVVTGNAAPVVEKFCIQHDIADYISRIYDKKYSFSKEDKITAAMQDFRFDSNRTYMIGDAVSDIAAARNTRIKSIAVSWGNQDPDLLKKAGADYYIDHPHELLDIFRKN